MATYFQNCFLKNSHRINYAQICFIPKLFRFLNICYCSCISYTGDTLFYLNFEFVSFYAIIPQYQDEIGIYSTFNLLRLLLLYYESDFQMVVNLRNHFRIQHFRKFSGIPHSVECFKLFQEYVNNYENICVIFIEFVISIFWNS